MVHNLIQSSSLLQIYITAAGTVALQPSASVAESGGSVSVCATLSAEGTDTIEESITIMLSTSEGTGKINLF